MEEIASFIANLASAKTLVIILFPIIPIAVLIAVLYAEIFGANRQHKTEIKQKTKLIATIIAAVILTILAAKYLTEPAKILENIKTKTITNSTKKN
jgi:branched-subunit amino acid transport protein